MNPWPRCALLGNATNVQVARSQPATAGQRHLATFALAVLQIAVVCVATAAPGASTSGTLDDPMSLATTTEGELGTDFGWLWRAHAASRFGVAFSMGAIAVIAVEELDASALAVALAFGVSRLVAALASIPVGVLVERRRKRPVLIGADLLRSFATLTIPLLLWAGQLTITLLAVAMCADTFLSIASTSASNAHLKDLVARPLWGRAFARLEATNWTLMAVFAPLGGLTVTLIGPTATLAIDAATYTVSALLLTRIGRPERQPTEMSINTVRAFATEASGGWRYIWRTSQLRALFKNAMLFGGSLVLVSPLVAVLALRELELAAWQYGTILGVPAVGGVVGAALAGRTQRQFGTRTTLLAFGTGRTLWTVWIAFSPPGVAGFAVIVAAELLLMFFAGVFNPVFAAYQTAITHDDYMARVSAAWSASALTIQPLFVIAGGLLTGVIGLRPTIAVAGFLLVTSSMLLPWRSAAEPTR